MKNKILRKSHNKTIFGVCEGIAEYIGWKPTQVRLLFFGVTLLGGSGIVVYIVMAIVMPNADNQDSDSFNIEEYRE